jgi:hypothetical protein
MTTEPSLSTRTPTLRLVLALASVLAMGGAFLFAATRDDAGAADPGRHPHAVGTHSAASDHGKAMQDLTGDRPETERFLEYERTIDLTPEQEAIRVEALEALPAPCCKQFSAATCCCKCNMARATWGLAKHLIVDQGADVETVRTTVAQWHHAINPDGFSGDSCFTGGCSRSFRDNGCGGMKDGELVF